ncbi:MAG: aconitase/3-isopropylmalate dehydratase large subunit family protein [Paralcaligenes sp.]
MRGQTIAEKILSKAAVKRVYAGDIVNCQPDLAMATDGSFPMAIDYLAQMEPSTMRPMFPERIILALDHYDSSSGPKALALQEKAKAYAREFDLTLFDAGEGVGHQLMLESGRIRPGMLVVGADSHSTTYSALNCFATGIGSSDLAGILLCGALWLRVPETIKVQLKGVLNKGVSGKDVALSLAKCFENGGANYFALEFHGDGLAQLHMKDRIVISNMAVEYGAKAAIFQFDEITNAWLLANNTAGCKAVTPDTDAHYSRDITIDLGDVVPQLALPHSVDNVIAADSADSIKVDTVYVGTCTAGRYEDFYDVFKILKKNGGPSPHVKLIITPASQAVYLQLKASGVLDEFVQYGALLQPPGCGSCCGTAGYRPRDGEVIISTANRNFKGRMGNAQCFIYLASPQTCAQVACTGYINKRASQ